MTTPIDPIEIDPFETTSNSGELKRKSINGSISIGLAQVAKIGISIVSQIFIARLLFPSDFGLLAIVYPVIGLMQIFNDLGFAQVIVQRATLEQERVSILFWINTLISFGLATIIVFISPVVAWLYGDARVLNIMIVLALTLPISALSVHPTALLTRQMKFGFLALIDLFSTLAGVIFTIVLAYYGLSYWSLIFGQLFTSGLNTLLSWMTCRWRPSRPAYRSEVIADLQFGGNITGANLASYVTTSSDNIIIGLMTGEAALGLYDRSYRLVVQPINQLISPISRVALPLLSRLSDRPSEYCLVYLQIVKCLSVLTLPGLIVCIVSSQQIIDVLLGKNWTGAGPVFHWICIGGLTSALYTSALWLFISQNRTRDMRNLLTIAAVLNLASFAIGAIWGIVAVAAAGACVFVFVTTPLVLYGAIRSGPVQNRDMLPLLSIICAKGIVVYAVLTFAGPLLDVPGFIKIIVSMFIAYSSYIALTTILPSDRKDIAALLHAVLISKIRRFS